MDLKVNRDEVRAILDELRAELERLEEEYNSCFPPDGEVTLGRRTRVAHQDILTKIADVKRAILQREKELGDA